MEILKSYSNRLIKINWQKVIHIPIAYEVGKALK